MNLSWYIARKLVGQKKHFNPTSRGILNASIATISVGVVVVLIAIASGKGLEQEIRKKLAVFTSDVRISHINNSSIHSYKALETDLTQDSLIRATDGVEWMQKVAIVPALLKNNTDVEQVFFKGFDEQVNWKNIESFITEGRLPKIGEKKGREVLMSASLGKTMGYKLGEEAIFTFFEEQKKKIKLRKCTIVGFFSTGMLDLDKQYIFGDIQLIRKLRGWKNDEFDFWEVQSKPYYSHQKLEDDLKGNTAFNLKVSLNKNLYPDIYTWIETFDYNIYILLIIIGVVASINLISTILILVLERSMFVGILKGLGMTANKIRGIFSYYMLFTISKGLAIGNLIGIGFCIIQWNWKVIPLDAKAYHISYVPIYFAWKDFLLVNIIMLIISGIFMILPLFFVNKINPIKILRFK